MTIATLLVALLATSAADTSGDPVLLDFHASWCGPCRQMRPEVEKLVEKGYPVKSVDVDRSPELSDRYRVKAIPTYVIIDSKGKALARTSGAMPALQLATFYNETKLKAASKAPSVEPEERGNAEDVANAPANSNESPAPAPLVNPKPWQTVVRIKMHLSDSEWGFGSGTIIYSSAEESIILTCAHIFRLKGQQQPSPKNFRVPISIDLFTGQPVRREPFMLACAEKDVPGEAIDYDFTNDVGLIRIRPGRKLPASQVVPPWWSPKKGMKMVTVGCSHGADATAWDTQILDPRVGMSNTSTKQSFATIKCAHQPKEGRSGGGLYTTDGYVAGVCDFADPNEHVGLYAVPEAIHRLLDRNELTALYKPSTNGALLASRTRTKPPASSGTKVRAQNAEDADAVTLPPPSLVGIANPSTDAVAKAWRSRSAEPGEPRRARPIDRPEVAMADSVDPGARPGEALQTELSLNPGDEARAFERLEAPATPASKRPSNAASTVKPQFSGWKGAREALPDLAGPQPMPR
jgi:thiol-disulfide isomerase/thioredoxin